jgi:SAM-dependent methyltransferase
MAIEFSSSPSALPPISLVQRVVPPFPPENAELELRAFAEGGKRSIRSLEQGLAAIGRELGGFEEVLDFGCGPGRTLRWLEPLAAHARLHGTDVDPDAIEWASEHIPFATFATAPHQPPLPYEDHSFDLVLNHSVFTHLDEERQDLWLEELRRVSRPGAILLLTVHSANQWRDALRDLAGGGSDPEPWRRAIERDGHVFIADDLYVGSSHPDWYHTAFHAPWYLFEHWHRFFELRAYLPRGAITQDLLVLERRPDDAPVPEPIGHREGPAVAVTAADAAPPTGGEGDALDRLERLLDAWPPPRTALGRLKRRLLSAERDREERMWRGLIAAVREARDAPPSRFDVMSRVAINEQGQRMAVMERELRAELAELRTRHADRG